MKIQSCPRREKTKASYCNDVQSNVDIQRGIKINLQHGRIVISRVIVSLNVYFNKNWKIEKLNSYKLDFFVNK